MKKHFITGLLILLPVALTIAIVVFIVNFLTQPFIGAVSPIISKYLPLEHNVLFLTPTQIIEYGSQFLILISLFVFTFLLGMVGRWFFIKSLISLGDNILHKIPVINKVYKTSQEIIKTLFVSDKNSFKQVVLVPFPNEHSFVMGLISKESPLICKNKTERDLVSVLVPTAPNPTTGYIFMYDKKKLIPLSMSAEDAIKFIVSCGVVTPDHHEHIKES